MTTREATAPGLRTAEFDYPLPRHLIAQRPAARRDESRLLVVARGESRFSDQGFRDLLGYVQAGDAVVVNDTRVFPARLVGRKPTGANVEILLLRPLHDRYHWEGLVRPGGKLKPGRRVEVGEDLEVEILESAGGKRVLRLVTSLDPETALARYGHVPLPPYIEREDDAEDRERYQTVYAVRTGSVAAPTAGLHFTPELLGALARKGARLAAITLHVGPGTFRPVEVRNPAEHQMNAEWVEVAPSAAAAVDAARREGGHVWAVGTTVARALETAAAGENGCLQPYTGWTRLFIRPPYSFRVVDRLLTNFHLPRSTLLMLVAAFAGHDLTMRAYAHAVSERYRFYSYGDAMLIL